MTHHDTNMRVMTIAAMVVALLAFVSGANGQIEILRPPRPAEAPRAAPPASKNSAAAYLAVRDTRPALVVAQEVIARDFDPPECPRVAIAEYIQDGTIIAICTNKSRFRVFTLGTKLVALNCSAAEELLGVKC
jgi:hypothetical protein